MDIKVKFTGISHRGKYNTKTKQLNCPDFQIKSTIINNIHISIDIDSQIMKWLDGLDKSFILIENDWACILDYSIVKPKVKDITIGDFMDYMHKNNLITELLYHDCIHCYNEIDKKILQGKSIEKQFKILLSHIDIGYKAAIKAYKNISGILTDSASTSQLMIE